jgi:hypothetical protein
VLFALRFVSVLVQTLCCAMPAHSLTPSPSSPLQFALEAAEDYDPVRELRRKEAEDVHLAKQMAAERASAKMLKHQ